MNILLGTRKPIQNALQIQLLKAGFLHPEFDKVNTNEQRLFIHRLIPEKNEPVSCKVTIFKCFELFDIKFIQKSEDMFLKQLCFIHMVGQEIRSSWKDEGKIQLCLEILQERLQKIMKVYRVDPKLGHKPQNQLSLGAKSRIFSMAKLTWIKDKLSISKDKTKNKTLEKKQKQQVVKNKTSDKDSKNKNLSLYPEKKHLQQNICSIEMLLSSKITDPYTFYLLKIMATKTIFLPTLYNQIRNNQKIWLLINLLLKLIQVIENFNQIIRYSPTKRESLITILSMICHEDIRYNYNILSSLVKQKKQQIDSVFMNIRTDMKSKQIMKLIYEKTSVQLGLNEFKEMIEQICVINQGLNGVYYSKYLYQSLIFWKIQCPEFIKTSGEDYDFIFDTLKLKQKSLSKSQHNSPRLEFPKNNATQNKAKKLVKTLYNPARRQKEKLKLEKKQTEHFSKNISSVHYSKLKRQVPQHPQQ